MSEPGGVQGIQVVPAGHRHPGRPPMHPKGPAGEGRHLRPGGSDVADLQPRVCGADQEGFQENQQE